MQKECRVSSLTAIFGNTEDKSQDSEKLLNLYWNRAELKKEFAGMRKEQFKLQHRIKQQEGATARALQKLGHLEELLIDPHWVHNVTVFYQLRNLARRCESKLAKFAEQLKQQREKKQHNNILARWNEARTQTARRVDQQILLKRDVLQQLEDQLHSERHRLMRMSGFLKFFRRRSVTENLDNLAAQIDALRQEELELQQLLKEIRDRAPPDNEGLGISTKRSINLMILSFAQQLVIHFTDDDLAVLVKESREKSVGSINYGDRRECGYLLDRIEKRVGLMEQAADYASVLQQRAQLLGQKAEYRQDSEAVPIAASVAILFNIEDNGVVQESHANLLGENYWGIASTFSR